MNTNQILSDLRAECNRLDHAIDALEALRDGAGTTGGRSLRIAARTTHSTGGRQLSKEGRARIAAAARARWAKVRAQKKDQGVSGPQETQSRREGTSSKGHRISPEGRARIIAATKARWARLRAANAAAGRKAASVGKKAAATTAPRKMTPAARKRIAEAMRKRWATRKKAA